MPSPRCSRSAGRSPPEAEFFPRTGIARRLHAFAYVWPTGCTDTILGDNRTMTTTASTIEIPGYRAGTWKIDTAHSEVGFSIRHIMISKVKGKFERFDATFVTAENPLESSVT